jgi:hypothetical protein
MKNTSINAQELNPQLLESFSNLCFSELRIYILFLVFTNIDFTSLPKKIIKNYF